MLNTASVQAVDSSVFTQHFIRPHYDSYCFSNFPATIRYLLTGEGQIALPHDVFGSLPTRYQKVVFFFVDAFGWQFFERYAEKYDFLKLLLAEGVVSKLTSQFPSTTAAHVTCMHTGLNVGQTGIYEWNYYEPLVDTIISPLLFSYARDVLTRDTLKAANVPAAAFFPEHTFYQALQAKGVASHILQYQGYTPSSYSDVAFQGASVHPYNSIQEALVYLAELLAVKAETPTYYFVYFDRIDAVCHRHGPNSKEFEQAVHNFLMMMQELFYTNTRGRVKDTLLMLSADHGQIEVFPQTTYYLDQQIAGFDRFLKSNRQGQLLVPAGSARDMFLYLKEESFDEAIEVLQHHLAGKAEVHRTRDLLKQHFFGLQDPSERLLYRLGNAVILPYAHETVWWSNNGKPTMHFKGHHGGLTREEMEIPLLLLSF